ncbi:MAG: hypothetical protein KAS72_03500 [Phycisphaerales bacterium]|nr:hypothetical protein [Phycisphaerales bacterium]
MQISPTAIADIEAAVGWSLPTGSLVVYEECDSGRDPEYSFHDWIVELPAHCDYRTLNSGRLDWYPPLTMTTASEMFASRLRQRSLEKSSAPVFFANEDGAGKSVEFTILDTSPNPYLMITVWEDLSQTP